MVILKPPFGDEFLYENGDFKKQNGDLINKYFLFKLNTSWKF